MKFRKIFLVGAMLAAPFAAQATDLPNKKKAPNTPVTAVAQSYNWSGWYMGGNVGFGKGANTGDGWTSFIDNNGSIPPYINLGAEGYFAAGGNVLPGTKPKGSLWGVQIGYNYAVSPEVILGLVTDIQSSNMRDERATSVTPPSYVPSSQVNESKINWLGTARAKFGFAADNILLFGTAGVAYGGVKTATAFDCPDCSPAQFFAGSTSATHVGWATGAGVDYGLSANWIISAEYMHYDLGSVNTTTTLVSGTNDNTELYSKSAFHGDVVRMSINYKFN
jgi:outer membrane immunogenic protein